MLTLATRTLDRAELYHAIRIGTRILIPPNPTRNREVKLASRVNPCEVGISPQVRDCL